MDANYIINGKRTKKKGIPKRDGSGRGIRANWNRGGCHDNLKGLMAKPRNILGDRVTKRQRMGMRSPFKDSDGDGVINGLDCAPWNKRRHSNGNEDFEKEIKRCPECGSYQVYDDPNWDFVCRDCDHTWNNK